MNLSIQKYNDQENALKVECNRLEKTNIALQAESTISKNTIASLQDEIKRLKQHKEEMTVLYHQYKDYIKQNSEALINKFQNFASNTLEQNNIKFIETSGQKIDNILNPLKYKIETFQKQVDEHYNKELEGRTSLNTEIKLIAQESKKIAHSCNNLSEVLRGNRKIQGNWGELVLRKVLESSGLREGEEYQYQAKMHHTSRDDHYSISDILISLPENKHIVIDAKTPLKYYEAYHNEIDNNEKENHLRSFLEKLKNHIKDLSSKEYQRADFINSPDFTIMFIPIDSAFILALQNDHDIQNFALKNNIIISSPSLLIAILKTIASIWRLSEQNANAQKIANAAGDMYNKFCSFIEDMKKVSVTLDRAKITHDNAFNKLYYGKGNLIKRSEDIKNMGVNPKASKTIPDDLLDTALMHEKIAENVT